ncbi:phosphotransferase-like protein [Mycobacterium branderi]|nr:AAA family ATPase [Mycobacterium branderi]MCV7234590.1 AAA family ATPase [Mycobacterium branderi]
MTGRLVVITGTSGSGKTTTCREFIAQADDLWLHFGADIFLGTMTPAKFVDGGSRCTEGLYMRPDDSAAPDGPAHLALGRHGPTMIRTLNEMASAAVRMGQNVVMDHITTARPPILQQCVAQLHELPTLFVALKPSTDLLRKRIDDRLPEVINILGDEQGRKVNAATKSWSESMANEIFCHDEFDLVLDTGALSPPEVAKAIMARLSKGPGTALASLARKLDRRWVPTADTHSMTTSG